MKNKLITAFILSLMITDWCSVASAADAIGGDSQSVEAVVEMIDDIRGPALATTDGGLTLTASQDEPSVFMIYSITGQLVKNIRADAGESTSVRLQGGCYVVRCKNWVKKVVVR